ncbi:Na+/H+ antiporter NhaA [Streptomyces sp. NPDC005202]|uniref:Na+/H+ antiporter NhaA n=1 Tax=Streptomyces sp. NPDC005202 TaxID=3157021 RepID=UPI0033AEDF70
MNRGGPCRPTAPWHSASSADGPPSPAQDPDLPCSRCSSSFVVDDLVAFLVIAAFYSHHIRPVPLTVAAAAFAVVLAGRTPRLRHRGCLVVALGATMWAGLMAGGVDPVVAGLAVGLVTYAYAPMRTDLERATGLVRLFREQPSSQRARSAHAGEPSSPARCRHPMTGSASCAGPRAGTGPESPATSPAPAAQAAGSHLPPAPGRRPTTSGLPATKARERRPT